MKVAVLNRHWATQGGGERYAGALAEALATDHDVHLLSPTRVDWPQLEERLGLDLSRTTPRMVPSDPGLSMPITREYDVLVNCSFMSAEPNGARRGIYVVLFPTRRGGASSLAKRVGARVLGPVLKRDDVGMAWGDGFHPAERSGLGVFRWTSAEAVVHLMLPAGTPTRVRLTFLAYRPRAVRPATVLLEVDGRVQACTKVGGDLRPVHLDVELVGRGGGGTIALVIRSDTFVPDDGDGDSRHLGVPLASIQVGRGARAWLLGRLPFLASRPAGDFVATYQEIVSISEFTRRWVRRWWERDSRVIYPPVAFATGGDHREPLILSVGRFFDERFGHSKKQLELVRAFRTLVTRRLPGWELHLVGGCQRRHAEYLTRVRAEAQGLPVHFHIEAPGAKLRELYRRAGIYWHAAGLGESERRHPERLEHFGISTVEAMGAGAVPIVVGKAGQAEIVQHEVNGYHVRSLGELAARTLQVAQDPGLRGRLADAARRRAGEFSTKRFAERVRALVNDGASA